MGRKMLLLLSNISFRSRDFQGFKICKLARWWHHTLNQILIKYDEERYLSQFVSEMFHSLQYDSTKCAPQYGINSFVMVATNWVPDLPIIKGFSGCIWHSILIFANGASYAWSSKHKYVSSSLWSCLTFSELKITNILKSSGWGVEKSELPWKQNFYSHRCVSCRMISLPSFNGFCCKLTKIALFVYLI